jgi:hypothetical protein
MVEAVPGYRVLPSSARDLLLDEVRDTWDVTLNRAMTSSVLTADDLGLFATVGHRRGLTRFPLEDMKAGFEVAYVAGLQDCLAVAGTDRHAEMISFIAWGADQIPRVIQAVTGGYLEVCAENGELRPARELLLKSLLAGTVSTAAAEAAGVDPTTGYLILACQLPSEAGREDYAAAALASLPHLLWRMQGGELLVLLPIQEGPPTAEQIAAELVSEMAKIAGPSLPAAQAHAASPPSIPAAVEEVREALSLVSAMPDAQLRPYRLQELLVELAVARQPVIRQGLTDLLRPLRDGKDLTHTLEVLFECDLDREQTTDVLHIHRRTLTYRLQRIRALTGINPASAHGIQILRSALVATRLPTTLVIGSKPLSSRQADP